ncbi:MAG: histone deacetylase [Nitrososphaerota archaeon]
MADTPDTGSTSQSTSPTPSTTPSSSTVSPESTGQERLPTGLIYDPAMLDHRVPDEFPEVAERLERGIAMIEGLIAEETLPAERVLRLDARLATHEELTAVHTPAYVTKVQLAVERLREREGEDADPVKFATDVYISPGSYIAAGLAAGAPLVALDAIAEGRARNGYALVRPPGHHARPAQAMGFCLFNNVAVAARYAQRRWGWQKILIVDYDVHHGNGTQEMFYDDPDVVYFSTHQYPWYPGTGASTEMGDDAGKGATINVPLPPGSGWSVYDPIFRQVLWPVADRMKPDLVLLSAGFDAHWKDPLGDMRLCNADFSDLTLEVAEIADRYCEGRLVVVQEGGYHLDAAAQCMATTLVALTGSDGIVDSLGLPPPMHSRWNDEAIIGALYQLHDLAGYRRKPRRQGKRVTPEQTPESAGE